MTDEPVRCHHCKGTGFEPGREFNAAQWRILDELIRLGEARARWSTAKSAVGVSAREIAYAGIRDATERAVAAGIPKVAVADAVGVSPVQLYNILRRG